MDTSTHLRSKAEHLAGAALKVYEDEFERLNREINKLRVLVKDTWLKKGEAAKYLDISQSTLWRMENAGVIVFHNNRAKKSDLDKAIKEWRGLK